MLRHWHLGYRRLSTPLFIHPYKCLYPSVHGCPSAQLCIHTYCMHGRQVHQLKMMLLVSALVSKENIANANLVGWMRVHELKRYVTAGFKANFSAHDGCFANRRAVQEPLASPHRCVEFATLSWALDGVPAIMKCA